MILVLFDTLDRLISNQYLGAVIYNDLSRQVHFDVVQSVLIGYHIQVII